VTVQSSTLRICGLILAAGAPLAGCIAYDTPDDVTFVTAESVDYYDRPELPALGDFRIPEKDTLPKQHKLLLRVQFSTSVDLVQFARSGGYNLSRYAFFCGHPHEEGGMGNPDIFWQGISLSGLDRFSLRESGMKEGTAITYYVFIEAARGEIKSIPPLPPYDLRREPRDLCFQLRGGNQMGGYRSNTVVIPQAAISEALKELPPYYAGGAVSDVGSSPANAPTIRGGASL